MDNTSEKPNWKKIYIDVFCWGIACVLLFWLFTHYFNLP